MTKLKNSFVLAQTKELFGKGKEKWTKGALARFTLKPEEYTLNEARTSVVDVDPIVGGPFTVEPVRDDNRIDPETGVRMITKVTVTCNPDHPRADCFCMLGGVGKVINDNDGDLIKGEDGLIDWMATAAHHCMEFVACNDGEVEGYRLMRAKNYRDGEYYSAQRVYEINDRSELEYSEFMKRIDCAVDIAIKLDEEQPDGDEHKG